MNTFQMSTDKVLLTVFVTVLVGFLTAAMSIVRLVNDKESKTTDYRQAWTDSLRKCLASLISNVNTLASITTSRMSSADGISEVMNHEYENDDPKIIALVEKTRAYLDRKIIDEDEHIREVRRAMQESYALTRLHFKPNDLSFSRVEQKFEVIQELFSKLRTLTEKNQEGEREATRERIRSESNDLTAFSRDILKTEWEAVKRGEIAYQRTKLWSIVGGGVALVGLGIFGLATLWSLLRVDPTNGGQNVSLPIPSTTAAPSTALVSDTSKSQQLPYSPSTNVQTVNLYGSKIECQAQPRPHFPAKPNQQTSCPR